MTNQNLPIWVFVVGAYRTGSSTQYMLVEDIIQGTRSGIGIGYHSEPRIWENDKRRDCRYIAAKAFLYLPETSPYVKKFLEDGRLKAIGTCRDPRDIAVSMRERAKGLKSKTFNFTHLITQDFPMWLGHQFGSWASLGPKITMVTRFEDMIQDLDKEVRRIARHLNIRIDPAVAKRIAKRYTVEELKRRKVAYFATKKEGGREHPTLPSIPGIEFGTSGHWKTYLSKDEAGLIEYYNKVYMQRGGYLPR